MDVHVQDRDDFRLSFPIERVDYTGNLRSYYFLPQTASQTSIMDLFDILKASALHLFPLY